MTNLDAQKGGRVRAERLTSEERREIAITAAEARWGNPLPKAKYMDKPLVLGNFVLDCAVLDDESTRIVSTAQLLTVFGRDPKKGMVDNLPAIFAGANLRAFLSESEKELCAPIHYRIGNQKFTGYRAEIVPIICKCYMKANAAGKLISNQKEHAAIAEAFFDAFAIVGITALVDEATGFQRAREQDDLQRLMAKWVSPVMRPWMQTFPYELWPLIQKVFGWSYNPKNQQRHPEYGKFIDKYIYSEFPKEVHEELKRKAPKSALGVRNKKLHQGLSVDTGLSQLDQQIQRVMAALAVTEPGQRENFEYNFARIMGRIG